MKFTHPDGAFETDIQALYIAGWTGRNAAAVAHHIEELAAIGVAPPSTTPLFYRGSASLVVQSDVVQVLGTGTSGEAEPMLLRHDDTLWLGLGSDHTDREMEAQSVAASKQACPKPCAGQLWRFDEVADHVDALALKSWVKDDGEWVPYQAGGLDIILPLASLIDRCPLASGDVMLCGTLPAIGPIRGTRYFRAELKDPVLERVITFTYEVETLPVVG